MMKKVMRASFKINFKIFLMLILCAAIISCKTTHATKSANRQTQSATAKNIIQEARKHLGVKYKYGGSAPSAGFDCSGFTKYVFSQLGVNIPRTSKDQYKTGTSVALKKLRPDDLVFFGGEKTKNSVGHVGIVTSIKSGNSFEFIHASSSRGITIDSYPQNSYYRQRYLGARRP